MVGTIEVDSLVANEFRVELGDDEVSGIFRVAGLQTYATDEAGQRVKPPFELSKMVQRDANNAFNTWLRESIATRDSDDKPTRDLTVVAVDDGVVTRRWVARNARIMGVRYSEFDSSSFEMVAEIYTIAYDEIDEEWPTAE